MVRATWYMPALVNLCDMPGLAGASMRTLSPSSKFQFHEVIDPFTADEKSLKRTAVPEHDELV